MNKTRSSFFSNKKKDINSLIFIAFNLGIEIAKYIQVNMHIVKLIILKGKIVDKILNKNIISFF